MLTYVISESPYLRNEKQPLGGAVAVTVDSSNEQILDLEVLWAHTTDSMCIAFMSTNDLDAKVCMTYDLVAMVRPMSLMLKTYDLDAKV